MTLKVLFVCFFFSEGLWENPSLDKAKCQLLEGVVFRVGKDIFVSYPFLY